MSLCISSCPLFTIDKCCSRARRETSGFCPLKWKTGVDVVVCKVLPHCSVSTLTSAIAACVLERSSECRPPEANNTLWKLGRKWGSFGLCSRDWNEVTIPCRPHHELKIRLEKLEIRGGVSDQNLHEYESVSLFRTCTICDYSHVHEVTYHGGC